MEARAKAKTAQAEQHMAEQKRRELEDGAPLREQQRTEEEREMRIRNEIQLIRQKQLGVAVESDETDITIKKEALRRVADEQWKDKGR